MDILRFLDLERLKKTGNFSQAAELGNLSQPAFSRRIQSLENWAGVQLVDRSRQPVKLTAEGARLLEVGLASLTNLEQERGIILEAQSLPDKYTVNFAAQHSIGWPFYPSWLKNLEEEFGPILSQLRAVDLKSCMADLKNGEVDFVIAYNREEGMMEDDLIGNDLNLETIVIGQDKLIPVCMPDKKGNPIFCFETSRCEIPFLGFGQQTPIGKYLEPLFKSTDLNNRLKTIYENSMAGVLRIRAQEGDGVSWLPESHVTADINAGSLARIKKIDWEVNLDIVLHRDTSQSNRLTRSIWSFLQTKVLNSSDFDRKSIKFSCFPK